MRASISFRWMGMFFYLATIAGVSGQDAGSSQTAQQASPAPATVQVSQFQATLQAFEQEQQALGQQMAQLVAQGATSQQIEAWRQQNASQYAAQQQLALKMGEESALAPQPLIGAPNIPANASQTLKDFLTNQAALANARAQIHNQLLSAMPAEVTGEQISQMQQSEEQLFQQQHAADIQAQQQRAQTLANESAQQPLPVPPPLSIPPGTSPQMQTFLTLRDQLVRSRITLLNQYTTATPAERNAALDAWNQQNSSLFQQMQQAALALSQSTTTTQN